MSTLLRPIVAALFLAGLAQPALAYEVVDKELDKGPFAKAKFSVGGFFQPRFKWTPDDEDAELTGETTFTVQRIRLEVGGQLLAPDDKPFGFNLRTKFSFEFMPTPELKDAYVDLGFGTPFQFRVGQFKAPVHRGNLTSDAMTMFPDRDAFAKWGPDRDVGAMFFGYWKDHVIDWEAGVFGGDGSNVTKGGNRHLLYAGRVTFSPLGSPGTREEVLHNWKRKKDQEGYSPTFTVGYAFHYNILGVPGEEQTVLAHNAEAQVHWRFFTVNGEVTFRDLDNEARATEDVTQLGGYVSAAVFPLGVPWAQDHLAVLARMEQGDAKRPESGPSEDVPTLDSGAAFRKSTVGLGIYANKPMFKAIHDLRAVLAYSIRQELEGDSVDNDEVSLSMNASF